MALALGVGRPRKPTALKIAQGTYRPDRSNLAEPDTGAIEVGDPPATMGPEEAEVWRTLAPRVNEARVCTAGDLLAFSELCAAVVLARETRRDPDAKVTDKTAAQKNALLFMSQFGLTPASRPKVSAIGEAKGHDPLDEFV